MNTSLLKKNALICGSTQGIGFAIAKELALLGANCILMARNENSLQGALADLDSTQGQRHSYLVADFSNNMHVKQTIVSYAKEHKVHILINNTGGPPAGKIADAVDADFVAALNLHLINKHNITTALLVGMKS